MTANNGRAVLVQFAGASIESQLRSKDISFAGDPTDITTAGDSGWITFLPGSNNTQQWTVSIEGVEKTSIFADNATSGANVACVITVGDKFTLTGDFRVTGYSAAAPHDGEQTFACELLSSGPVVKAPVA